MPVHLILDVDRDTDLALNEQIRQRVIALISDGVLRPGVRMPSSRQLALDLRVSRSVVVEAYQQLTAEGWLVSRNRSGTQVSELSRHTAVPVPALSALVSPQVAHLEAGPPVRWNLVPGSADVRSFPREAWLNCLTSVVRQIADSDLGYPDVAGVRLTRDVLIAYLGRVRSVRGETDQTMMTSGFAQGLAVLCHMLLRRGTPTIGLEDPGHPGQRSFLDDLGMRTVPIPVDADGIDVVALERSRVPVVMVTPAHQFPTGVVLSQERRLALIDWARHTGGLIIEDDYDGEFWFDQSLRPPSLQSLAPDVVVYGGSASKTLAPGLRLGWLVVPEHMVEEIQQVRSTLDRGCSTIEQLAFAEFAQSGRLDKQLRRVRESYRHRFALVCEYMLPGPDDPLPGLALTGVAAGMHAHLTMPPEIDERGFVANARSRRVELLGASWFCHTRTDLPPGIVIGYAKQSDAWLIGALEVLRELLVSPDRPLVRQRRRHGS